MKIVIPAKENSSRVPSKNWRPFYQGKSLVEVKIEQLLGVFDPKDIYLSCDTEVRSEVAIEYGIQFVLRDSILAADETPWAQAVTGIIDSIPCSIEEDILWAEVTSPLFNEYSGLVAAWSRNKQDHDSLLTVNEVKEFLINEKGRAVNFNYGHWHCRSQDLEPLYSMEATFIMAKKNILEFNYPVGVKPYLFVLRDRSVEIDTLAEFELAQQLYTQKKKHEVD